MKLISSSVLLLALFSLQVQAQPALKPHIGVTTLPVNSEPICDIPTYLGDFQSSGYQVGDTVADFTLFNPEGEAFNLGNILSGGKPVLLVAGNYSCWRYRDQINTINLMANYYQGEVEVFIVYGVEAHPHLDISPYSEYVWTGERNFTDNVLIRQHTTYGDRLDVIAEMQESYGVYPNILVDDPCNSWWSNFGPAPVNAYLISPDGTVDSKHDWFQALPNDMWCDIDHYLGSTSPHCNTASNYGNFTVTLDEESSIVNGAAGEVLTVHTTIQNLSSTDNVEVDILREQVTLPQGWMTALCVNVCFNSLVSETSVIIPPGEAQSFVFYFYTGPEPTIGNGVVKFTNALLPNNEETIQFTAITDLSTSVEDHSMEWLVFPNPVNNELNIQIPEGIANYTLMDLTGKLVMSGSLQNTSNIIDLSGLSKGIYLLSNEERSFVQKIIKN